MTSLALCSVGGELGMMGTSQHIGATARGGKSTKSLPPGRAPYPSRPTQHPQEGESFLQLTDEEPGACRVRETCPRPCGQPVAGGHVGQGEGRACSLLTSLQASSWGEPQSQKQGS